MTHFWRPKVSHNVQRLVSNSNLNVLVKYGIWTIGGFRYSGMAHFYLTCACNAEGHGRNSMNDTRKYCTCPNCYCPKKYSYLKRFN